VRILNNNEIPVVYEFLKRGVEFNTYSQNENSRIEQCDVLFVLDTGTPERLGRMESLVEASPAFKVCIDHHRGYSGFADFGIVDVSVCSVSELIYGLITNLGGKITPEIAEALYVGVLTDTENFSNEHTNSGTHQLASELLSYGVDPAAVNRKVYDNSSWQRFFLFKKTLDTITSECGGKLVWMKIDGDMVAESGAMREEMDGFVDSPLRIAGVEMSILFLEVPGRGTKISIRSREKIDSHAFARIFRGGGHTHSAGIRMYNVSLDDAVGKIIPKARELF
jgi:phosphoesterase RecJ-like protein